MSEEDRKPFAEMIAGVYELYNRPLSESILEMWWTTMVRFDLASVREALGRHAMNPDAGMFIPKPADVVRELGGTSADASMLAWSKVVNAIKAIGTHESVTFDDPIVNRVLKDLGGWYWLGTQKESEMPFIEKRFRDAYRAWRQRGLSGSDPVSHLPGLFELSNGHMYPDSVKAPKLIGDLRAARALYEGKTVSLITREG